MNQQPVYSQHDSEQTSFGLYLSGFIGSLVLTLVAYALVKIHVDSLHETFSHPFLIVSVITLALVQFLVQLYCFLHLGRENRPRWKLLVLLGMISVVLILVLGSLWIMYNLNYRMTPQQINSYMQQQDGGF